MKQKHGNRTSRATVLRKHLSPTTGEVVETEHPVLVDSAVLMKLDKKVVEVNDVD